ncbi:MAG: uroporphyrinogen decarboxylase family protein [Phycisphaerae bacterium]
MSRQDGLAALHLDMPPRVPRTEYSAHTHWRLVNAVCGTDLTPQSPKSDRQAGSLAFRRAWDYCFNWSILIDGKIFGDLKTDMGHAEYADGGGDKRSTVTCPFTSPEQVLVFDFDQAYGRRDPAQLRADFEAHYQAQDQQAGQDWVPMTGIYVTLISGLLEIFGWDMLLMAMGTDPRAFGELTNRYTKWIAQYFDALAAADVPVVMVHDDIVWTSGPFCNPDWYRQFVFPNHRRLIQPLIESGKRVLFTSDGDYSMFIDDIAANGVHAMVMEPMTDLGAVADAYGDKLALVGNVDTRVLLNGSRQQIRGEVDRCMATAKHCPGFILAVGNHIPSNTPVENALYYNEVYNELAKR